MRRIFTNTGLSARLRTALFIALSILLTDRAHAVDRHVPGTYATIQAAINACNNGDVVVLADGTYTGAGNYALTVGHLGARTITIRSASEDPALCAIDGAYFRRCIIVFLNSHVTFRGIRITHCQNSDGFTGGAVIVTNAGASFINCEFIENRVTNINATNQALGGALLVDAGAQVFISGSLFESNTAGIPDVGFATDDRGRGGAICVQGATSTLNIVNSSFINNAVDTQIIGSDSQGGAIYLNDNQSITIDECAFDGNSAADGVGGDIYSISDGIFHITDTSFTFASADLSGGSMRVDLGGGVWIQRCEFTTCAADDFGGAIASSGGAILEIQDTGFHGCFSGLGGGAIDLTSSQLLMERCTFTGNQSTAASAIYVYEDDFAQQVLIVNSLFADNINERFGTLAFENTLAGEYIVANCTIANNTSTNAATGLCAGLRAHNGSVHVYNSILYYNDVAGVQNRNAQVTSTNGGLLDLYYCNVQNLEPELIGIDGLMDQNPRFINAGSLGDYHLRQDSPCIDAGDNQYALNYTIPSDIDLQNRRMEVDTIADTGAGAAPIVDIGADEAENFPYCYGDANFDNTIDVLDLLVLGSNYSCGGCGCPGDLNADCATDQSDLGIVLTNYHAGCPGFGEGGASNVTASAVVYETPVPLPGDVNYTVDLLAQAGADAWTSTAATATILGLGTFYEDSFGTDAPNPAFWDVFPHVEYDSFYSVPPDFYASVAFIGPVSHTPQSRQRTWLSIPSGVVPGTHVIARYTIRLDDAEVADNISLTMMPGPLSEPYMTITGTMTSLEGGGNLVPFSITIYLTISCPADFDQNGEVGPLDWFTVVQAYGNNANGDLDGDNDTDRDDVALFGADDLCPNSPPYPGGPISHQVVAVDNTSGDGDPLYDFLGGVTHFTFDLQTVATDDNWTTTSFSAVLTEPGYSFFQHFHGSIISPNSSQFGSYPALPFDTFVTEPGVLSDGNSIASFPPTTNSSTNQTRLWTTAFPTGHSGTVARYTIKSPEPVDGIQAVPQGTGGSNAHVIGTITGDSTLASTGITRHAFAYDLIIQLPPCPADLVGDDDIINVSDLFALLANWNNNGLGADLAPPTDIVNTSDLFALLAAWGTCP